ncbi:hypothetical protein NESM_000532200 [Novymonas esmeraldas]|uniref:Uncharacterized protein n=1 Tax=Novymonas esmeraldas TaxID=1808958 RepID=A0AAW0ESG6_9TRYP
MRFTSLAPRLLRRYSSSGGVVALDISRRGLSHQASRWLDRLRYGADDAPTMGSWESAYDDDAIGMRKLYCKALVHASGGSRLARDWIAGCAALTSPDPSLIHTALQHDATEADVHELREYILSQMLEHGSRRSGGRSHHQPGTRASEVRNQHDEDDDDDDDDLPEVMAPRARTGRAAITPAAAPESSSTTAESPPSPSSSAPPPLPPPTPESIRDAEHCLLQHSPEVRCFMYDAMTAGLFHSNNDLRTVEAARRHTFAIGAIIFGLSFDELTALWRVVEAELLLKKEKTKVLGQQWGE